MYAIVAHGFRRAIAGPLLLLAVLVPGSTVAVERAEPLQVPLGPPAAPDQWPGVRPEVRLELAATDWRLHGYRDLPILAWSALRLAARGGRPGIAKQAAEWAPRTPGVQAEVARLTRDPRALIRALVAIPGNLPALLWITSVAGAALGVGLLVATAIAVLLCWLRVLPLLGHTVGHLWSRRPGATWPGALVGVCAVAALSLCGLGPALLVAVLAAISVPFLSRVEGTGILLLLTLAGLSLGPPLDRWAAVTSSFAPDGTLLAAWRVEHGQPLPGDRSTLESRHAAGSPTPFETVALAVTLKRHGKLAEVEHLLEDFEAPSEPYAQASAWNLLGTARLARGDVLGAIDAFSSARSNRETASVLYNLSQSHGRALHLNEQSRLFAAARERDSTLVSDAAATIDPTIHGFVLETPLPLSAYFRSALRGGPDASRLAAGIRRSFLGPVVPPWGWLVIPVLCAIGLLRPSRYVRRCVRCFRTVCARCSGGPASSSTCLRCRRLAAGDASVDPRVRRRERDRDLGRQRALTRLFALLGLVVPGSAPVLSGSLMRGFLVLLSASVGAAAVLVGRVVPPTEEIGILAPLIHTGVGAGLLGLAYITGLVGSVSRWRARETRA